jgi:hypothetical protein
MKLTTVLPNTKLENIVNRPAIAANGRNYITGWCHTIVLPTGELLT